MEGLPSMVIFKSKTFYDKINKYEKLVAKLLGTHVKVDNFNIIIVYCYVQCVSLV